MHFRMYSRVLLVALVGAVATAACPSYFDAAPTFVASSDGPPAHLDAGLTGFGSSFIFLDGTVTGPTAYGAVVGSNGSSTVAVINVDKTSGVVTTHGTFTASALSISSGRNNISQFGGFGLSLALVSAPNSMPIVFAVGLPAGGANFRGGFALIQFGYPSTFTVLSVIDDATPGVAFHAADALFGTSMVPISYDCVPGPSPCWLAVSAPGGTRGGAVYILQLTHDLSGVLAAHTATPVTPTSLFGAHLAVIGDVDANGVTDVAITSPSQPGFLHVALLDTDYHVMSVVTSHLPAVVSCIASLPNVTYTSALLAVGDVNNDAVPDVGVGVALSDPQSASLAVFLMFNDGNVVDVSPVFPAAHGASEPLFSSFGDCMTSATLLSTPLIGSDGVILASCDNATLGHAQLQLVRLHAVPSVTPTPSPTPSVTSSASLSPSATYSVTPSFGSTLTPSISESSSVTASRTSSESLSSTRTRTISMTGSVSVTASSTATVSRSATPSRTSTPTYSVTPSITRSVTPSRTATKSPFPSVYCPFPVTAPYMISQCTRAGVLIPRDSCDVSCTSGYALGVGGEPAFSLVTSVRLLCNATGQLTCELFPNVSSLVCLSPRPPIPRVPVMAYCGNRVAVSWDVGNDTSLFPATNYSVSVQPGDTVVYSSSTSVSDVAIDLSKSPFGQFAAVVRALGKHGTSVDSSPSNVVTPIAHVCQYIVASYDPRRHGKPVQILPSWGGSVGSVTVVEAASVGTSYLQFRLPISPISGESVSVSCVSDPPCVGSDGGFGLLLDTTPVTLRFAGVTTTIPLYAVASNRTAAAPQIQCIVTCSVKSSKPSTGYYAAVSDVTVHFTVKRAILPHFSDVLSLVSGQSYVSHGVMHAVTSGRDSVMIVGALDGSGTIPVRFVPGVLVTVGNRPVLSAVVSPNGTAVVVQLPSWNDVCYGSPFSSCGYHSLTIENPAWSMYEPSGIACPPHCPTHSTGISVDTQGIYMSKMCSAMVVGPACLESESASSCSYVSSRGVCVKCPKGALCPGGDRVWPDVGHYAQSETAHDVYACPPPSHARCRGWNASVGSSQCQAGFSGFFCLECDTKMFKPTMLAQCEPCPTSDVRTWPFVLGMGIVILLTYVSVVGVVGFLTRKRIKPTRQVLPYVVCERIGNVSARVLMLGQLLAQVARTVDFGLPHGVLNLCRSLAALQFDVAFLIAPSCGNFVLPYHAFNMALALLPAGLLGLLSLFPEWIRLCYRPDKSLTQDKQEQLIGSKARRLCRWLYLVTVLTLPVAINAAVAVVSCERQASIIPGASPDLFMSHHPHIMCYTDDSVVYTMLGWLTIVLVGVAFPTQAYLSTRFYFKTDILVAPAMMLDLYEPDGYLFHNWSLVEMLVLIALLAGTSTVHGSRTLGVVALQFVVTVCMLLGHAFALIRRKPFLVRITTRITTEIATLTAAAILALCAFITNLHGRSVKGYDVHPGLAVLGWVFYGVAAVAALCAFYELVILFFGKQPTAIMRRGGGWNSAHKFVSDQAQRDVESSPGHGESGSKAVGSTLESPPGEGKAVTPVPELVQNPLHRDDVPKLPKSNATAPPFQRSPDRLLLYKDRPQNRPLGTVNPWIQATQHVLSNPKTTHPSSPQRSRQPTRAPTPTQLSPPVVKLPGSPQPVSPREVEPQEPAVVDSPAVVAVSPPETRQRPATRPPVQMIAAASMMLLKPRLSPYDDNNIVVTRPRH